MLYEAIKKAIINESLKNRMQLPPSRVIARDLNISRSTSIKAYELLVLEKYVKSIPGSGYFVSFKKEEIPRIISKSNLKDKTYPSISRRGNSFRKNVLIVNNSKSNKGVAFRPGLPPLDIFPISQWKNIVDEYWRTLKYSELSYSNPKGKESLRQNISNYLKIYRNIDCDLNQVIITTGSLHSLSLIADTLLNKKDEVILENPTYQHAYHLFDSLKACIIPALIDKEGMDFKNIKCKNPKLIYSTPSNQYPTGIKMSLNRRIELLKWAAKNSSIIVEDDYDHEFSNWENPIPSIYSLDKQERVVYLGTFNKLLHPSIRLGYMIVPNYLIDTVTAFISQSNRFVPPSLQRNLSTFIEKDYLNKHLRNVLEISQERKELFYNYFNQIFNGEISIESNHSGLHIIGKLSDNIDDKKLSSFLFDKGIITYPYSNYFMGENKKNGLVMGYSSVNNKLIKENITKMKNEYLNFLKS